MPRVIFAFNGDLDSRLALNWLARDRGYEVVTLLIDLGQEIYLEPLGELALELGAASAQVVDRREPFLREFALPALQAGAVFQGGAFLGSALGRYVVARELVRVAREEGCTTVAHAAAGKGNDQVRMETALAAQAPGLKVLAPVREWGLRTDADKLNYAHRRRLPVEETSGLSLKVDRNLWGVSVLVEGLTDPWEEPPAGTYQITRSPDQAAEGPQVVTVGFEEGVPRTLDGVPMAPLPLVRELNRIGAEHGIGRSDVIEDRLFGLKSREFYEAPAATLLLAAHRDLEQLVQSRELIALKEPLGRRYAELIYGGMWFSDLRRSLQGFFDQTQRYVTGEVRLRLYKGGFQVVGRRSAYGLYDPELAAQVGREWFDSRWSQAFAHLWTLPARLAARRQPPDPVSAPDVPRAGGER